MGGLSKKAVQIQKHSGPTNKPALILDSGNLLFKNLLLKHGQQDTAIINAEGILDSYLAMNAKIVNIGRRDLAAGIDLVREFDQKPGLEWLSANLLETATNEQIFPPYLTREVSGLIVAVIGLTDHTQTTGLTESNIIVPWQKILPDIMKEAAQQTDIVILLSSYPLRVNREIAAAYSNIHIIFQSGYSSGNLGPVQLNNTLICQTASRGKYLGILDVKWSDEGIWQKDVRQQNADINHQLTRVEAQIRRRKTTMQAAPPDKGQELERLQSIRNSLLAKRETLARVAAAEKGSSSSYSNRFIALRPSMPDDDKVKEIVNRAKREMKRTGRGGKYKSP